MCGYGRRESCLAAEPHRPLLLTNGKDVSWSAIRQVVMLSKSSLAVSISGSPSSAVSVPSAM
jgi:hypothetical protein